MDLRSLGQLVHLTSLALLLPACLIETGRYEQRRAALTDDDGDGLADANGDCDDANPNVYGGAPELCNGFDDNCDGAIDELAESNDVAWAADADGDGYASPDATPYRACVSPGPGWVSAVGDCDDADATVFPEAPEACDGLDNDCDGAADEEPTVAPPTWYPDEDGDSHGQLEGGVAQCLPPGVTGWSLQDTDCDDTDPAVHPDASERCNGVDDDCDEETDEAPVLEGGGWFPDEDADGFGDESGAACAAAEGYVEQGGDCDDANGGVHPAAVEICNDRLDNDCDGTPGACVWGVEVDMTEHHRITAAYPADGLGYHSGHGDLDGDGHPELVVSANGSYSPEADAQVGSVRVFRLPITDDLAAEASDWVFWGEHHYSGAGCSLLIHDLDGDGTDDLQVGSHNTVDGHEYAGTLYTTYGPLTEGGALEDVADWKLVGTEEVDLIGFRAHALGDLDGDGRADFGTGYEYTNYRGVYRSGVIYVFTSAGTGTEPAADVASAVIYGSDESEDLGLDATGLDIDGDGVGDLVAGAQSYDGVGTDGAAVVFLGPVEGSLGSADADAVFLAEGSINLAGRKVAPAGDTNGDGLDDLLVGAGQAGDGSAYLIWGDLEITHRSLADADVKFRGDRRYARFGQSVDGLGDLNEDGWPDLFISEGNDTIEGVWAYVYFGPFPTSTTLRSSEADVVLTGSEYDHVYEAAFTPGDATGDGVPDLVVSSYKYGATDWDGRVYVVEGVGY